MRLSFLLVAFLIISCGKVLEDGMECTGVDRNAGSVSHERAPSLVQAVGNYARLKYIYDQKINPILENNLSPTREESINNLGVTLRNRHAITFDNLKAYPGDIKGWIGVCCKANKKIIIDSGFWDSTTQDQRNLLIMHELGHCDIGREHTPQGVKSIMYSSIITPGVYNPNSNYPNKELEPSPEKYSYDRELFLETKF